MDINSISSLPALFDAVSLSSATNSTNSAISAESTSTSASSADQKYQPAQTLSVRSNIDYIQQQLNDILQDYPPWFPAGSPQRIDTIKAMKSVLENVKNSSISEETKKYLSKIQLKDNATDQEISTALDAIAQFNNNVVGDGTQEPGSGKSGNIINIEA